MSGGNVGDPVQACPLKNKKTDWIEFKVLYDEGEPLVGERFRVELPDEDVREGNTGEHGLIRLDGIDPGTCKISFPNLDSKAWKLGSPSQPKSKETGKTSGSKTEKEKNGDGKTQQQKDTSKNEKADDSSKTTKERSELSIYIIDSSDVGFKNFDSTAKEALRAGVEAELRNVLPSDVDLLVKTGRDAERTGGESDQLDVNLVNTNIAAEPLRKILKKHGQETDEASFSRIQRLIASGHGLSVRTKGHPGAVLVAVGPIFVELGGQGLLGGEDAVTEARKVMGMALSRIALHEIGHDFGLAHTKKGAVEVISDPPQIMDKSINFSTSVTVEEIQVIKFTDKERAFLKKKISERLKK